MEAVLSLIRRDAPDDRPDMWTQERLELGLASAARMVVTDRADEAILQVESVVKLLEETHDDHKRDALPTSCRFLDGMEWNAKEDWHTLDNNPDSPEERMIFIDTKMKGMSTCYCIHPSDYLGILRGKAFDPLRDHPAFEELCERVKALIVKKPKEE